MSSPSPIPPPNDRRSSRSSSNAGLPADAPTASEPSELLVVGGPPNDLSPIALRASHSPSSSSRRRQSRPLKLAPDLAALEYPTAPDSNLVCLICHAPFDRPVQLPCEHYFCRDCLDHAWAPQLTPRKTCPTCRCLVESDSMLRPVPKIIDTMLAELLVKCPNTRAGCSWLDQRANVHDHVMLYCEHTPVECPAPDCRLQISQKDFHKGCLHYTVSCDDCHTALMKKDLDDHQRTTCPNRSTACALCATELLRLDLKTHINTACPRHIISCQGTIIGCKFRAERADVLLHEATCGIATMAPHFREQQARLERHEARLEPLTRRVGILEDGLSNITTMLYPANANDASFPVTDHLDSNAPTLDFRLPSASFPPVAPGNDNSSTQPPFDSQVHHLLTLHDSLRDEVSRIANTLMELEGRTNMMVINESQRTKDEMLHTNAAINGMRMQLHWLMSATLHQRSNSAGSSTTRAAGSTGATTSSRSATQGAGSRPGPSGTLPAPFRRLSDSTRQDTKL